ncbi:MAG: hypothetical protein R2784_18755 [Saprospiraceae bacterium]
MSEAVLKAVLDDTNQFSSTEMKDLLVSNPDATNQFNLVEYADDIEVLIFN